MDNNQDNFNNNPQANILNNQNNSNNNQPLNVIPTMNPVNNNETQNDAHQFDNAFMNTMANNNNINNTNQNTFFNNPVVSNQNTELPQDNEMDELNKVIKTPQNRFINDNIDTTANSLNDLNIETGNADGPKVDYSKDPKVMENLNKKNTINITSEGKIFIVIIIALLIFIFVLPTVFDFIRKIQYQ